MKRDNFCLGVIWACDWDCPYCMVDTHSQKEYTLAQIERKLDLVTENADVSISGGEPGLLSKTLIKKIFDNLIEKKCLISVNTNGLFFKNHPEYDKYISSYFYHCSMDLSSPEIYKPTVAENKIDYMVVITDKTIDNLEPFLLYNKDILFKVFAADSYKVKGKKGDSLSKKNAFRIVKEYKHLIHKDSIHNLLSTSMEVNNKRGKNEISLQHI